MMVTALLILLNATYSMLSYRRFKMMTAQEKEVVAVQPSLDLYLEVSIGMVLGILGAV